MKVDASWQVGDSQCVFELFDTASVNVGLDVVGVDSGDLPYINLWAEDKPMDIVWYWPENPLAAPVVLSDPEGQTADPGETVSFYASASGNPAPTYQWYRDGQLVAYGSSLSVTAGSYTTGDYKYKAINNRGTVWSAEATLSLDAGGGNGVPSGMAFIPAGTFQMGDTFGEGDSDEFPVHSVYVSGFYMDKHEVTKVLWDEVYNWAETNGYSFDHAGSGKAANHPVHSVSWYDCVKWCNARSEKEGRTPCYTVGGNPYKTGQSAPSCNFNTNGYRLPTEAEWEKAARGGLNGRRFPWGNTILHSKANYRGSSGNYSYDYSNGLHRSYNDGGFPYTSPVGSFDANGYGLHDMVGNVWEWCWDWYGYYYATSPYSNPHGSSTGSNRVARGCCWSDVAGHCRSASRYGRPYPVHSNIDLGFRAALPAN